MLEPHATASAAERASAGDLEEIAEHRARMGAATEQHELMIDFDIAFHRRIAQASGNELLASMLEALSGRTQRARVWRGIIDRGSATQTIAEHRAMRSALEQRNPAAAYAAALMHVNTSEQWLAQFCSADRPAEL